MRLPGVWSLTALALLVAPAARGEELTCEFNEGTRSVARLDEAAGGWAWAGAPARAAEQLGTRPGASFWFMRARLSDGASRGSVAGSLTSPATDFWEAAVHRRPSQVMLVEVGSDNIRVLAVSRVQGRDGLLAASYSSQIGGPGSLLAEQYTGTCRSGSATASP
jgi:hypothetical protein